MNTAVRAGYKLTEVGVIPEDWEINQIKEFADVKGGKRLPQGKFVVDNITHHPYLRVSDMVPGRVDLSDIKYVPDDVFPIIKNYCISTKDLFISVAGSLGIVGRIPIELDGANLTENADKITNITCDRDFLLYNLMSDRIQGIIESEKTVGAQPKLAISRIENFTIALPPNHAEQRAIATALSDVGALLTKLDQLIAKKRDIKQAAMQQLLTGQTRLPGFSGDWEVKRLDALADIRGGGTPSTNQSEYWHGDIPWCTPTDITNLSGFKYLRHTARNITNKGLQSSSAELIPANSIVMTSRATIGECAINILPVATNQGFKNFIPYSGTDSNFLYYLLQTEKPGFLGLCSGSTFLELGKTQLVNFVVKIPDETEQTSIATILSDMDTELAALKARRDKTQALKQGMMQELLTGNIRLP